MDASNTSLSDRPTGLVVTVMTDPAALPALQPEWDDLATAARADHNLGFAWAQAGWACSASVRGGTLCVISVRMGGTLVGLWPLARFARNHHVELRQLGWDEWDFADLLLHPAADQNAVIAALWKTARGLGDVLHIFFTRANSPLAQVIRQRSWLATRDNFASYVADFSGHADFDSYCRTIAHSSRENARKLKRLSRSGPVSFQLETEPARKRAIVRWVLDEKMRWVRRNNLVPAHIARPDFETFIAALSDGDNSRSPLRIFSLRLNDQPLAGAITAVGHRAQLGFVLSMDPAWAKDSPGALLQGLMMEWAMQNGVNYDFNESYFPYKAEWSNTRVPLVRRQSALTAKGVPVVACEAARLAYVRLRSRWRRGLGWMVAHVIKPWATPILARLQHANPDHSKNSASHHS